MKSYLFFGQKTRAVDYLRNENPGFEIITVSNVENQIKNYSRFFDNKKLFLVESPNSEQIKLIASLNNEQYSLYFEDESFDGRNSFISKLKKENRIFDFSLPVYGDLIQLKRLLLNYLQQNQIEIEIDALNWLCQNCPTYKIKSKETSNKEKTVYDLELLYQELNKISYCKSKIELEDFENSFLKKDQDLFLFFDKIFDKDKEYIYSNYDYFLNEIGEQAFLLIFVSQILFLLGLQECKEKNIRDLNKIQEKLELRDLVNSYLSNEWTTINANFKTINPIRIKIQLNKHNPSVIQLSKMLVFTVQTISNLRNSGNKELEIFNLLTKLLTV